MAHMFCLDIWVTCASVSLNAAHMRVVSMSAVNTEVCSRMPAKLASKVSLNCSCTCIFIRHKRRPRYINPWAINRNGMFSSSQTHLEFVG